MGAAELQAESEARGLERALYRAVWLVRDGHGALAGARACLGRHDPRQVRIAAAALLIEVGLGELEHLLGQATGQADGT